VLSTVDVAFPAVAAAVGNMTCGGRHTRRRVFETAARNSTLATLSSSVTQTPQTMKMPIYKL
jgi:hypothetical protein